MNRKLDPEDRAAIAKAQAEGGQSRGKKLEATIAEGVENAKNDARAHQHDHPEVN